MSVRMTEAELAAYLFRSKDKARGTVLDVPPDDVQGLGPAVGCERDLHIQILDECKRRGWIALHGSMAEATARIVGEWDFTILADNGRVFFIEIKTKTGKLSTAQQGMIQWAAKLGHKVHVVRSLQEFLELTKMA